MVAGQGGVLPPGKGDKKLAAYFGTLWSSSSSGEKDPRHGETKQLWVDNGFHPPEEGFNSPAGWDLGMPPASKKREKNSTQGVQVLGSHLEVPCAALSSKNKTPDKGIHPRQIANENIKITNNQKKDDKSRGGMWDLSKSPGSDRVKLTPIPEIDISNGTNP